MSRNHPVAYRREMADLLASTPGVSSKRLAVLEGRMAPGTIGIWARAYGGQGSVGDAETAEVRRFVVRTDTELPGSIALSLALELLELGRRLERYEDVDAVAQSLLLVRDCAERADALLPEVGVVHDHLDRLTAELVERTDGVGFDRIGEVLRRRLDPRGLPPLSGDLPGFTVPTLLRDAEKAARESLHTVVGWYAPAILRSLIPMAQVGLDLAEAHEDPARTGVNGTRELRDQLARVERSWTAGTWPTNQDLRHPALARAGRSLSDVAALLATGAVDERPNDPDVRRQVLHSLHVATHASRSAVTSYIDAERTVHAPGPAVGEEGPLWLRRLDTFERLLHAQVAPRKAVVAQSSRPATRPVDHVSLRADLDAWAETADHAVRHRATPASLALIAQVQAMTIDAAERLVGAAEIVRDPDAPARDSRGFVDICERARTAWQELAARWMAASGDRPKLDHRVSDAAITLRESCSHLTHDGHRPGTPRTLASRPGAPEAADALLHSLITSQHVAVAFQQAVLDPHLNGATEAIAHRTAGTDETPRRVTRRPGAIGPAETRRGLAAATAEVVRRSAFLATAVHARLETTPYPANHCSHILQQTFLGAPKPLSEPVPVPTRPHLAAPAR